MQYEKYYLILFNSRNYAISVENMLKKKGLEVELFQAPQKLASNCTLAVKFSEDIYNDVMEIVKVKKSWIFRVYLVIRQNYKEMVQSMPF